MTDANGVPLVVVTTPANVPDQRPVESMLRAMPTVKGPRGRPRHKPHAIIGDRAYGTGQLIACVRRLGIRSLLAPRSQRPQHGSGLGKRRYVVERTLACFSHYRRLRLCYERVGMQFQAFHDLTACLLVYTRIKTLSNAVLK